MCRIVLYAYTFDWLRLNEINHVDIVRALDNILQFAIFAC